MIVFRMVSSIGASEFRNLLSYLGGMGESTFPGLSGDENPFNEPVDDFQRLFKELLDGTLRDVFVPVGTPLLQLDPLSIGFNRGSIFLITDTTVSEEGGALTRKFITA
jgi:hypothetical protein